MRKKPLVIMLIIVLVFIIAFLLHSFIGRNEGSIINKIENEEQSTTEIPENNPDVTDLPEKELDPYDDESLNIIRNKVKDRERSIIEILKNNPNIIDLSEKELYLYDDEIHITYENLEIEFLKNGNVEEVERELEEKLILLFEKLDCERISLKKEQFGKVLEIFLGDVKIDENNIYIHWIRYSENKDEDLGDEILPNWYYEVIFYT